MRKGLQTRCPRQARVVPLHPVGRIRRGTLTRGAPASDTRAAVSGTSRARCGGTAYPWPRVCSNGEAVAAGTMKAEGAILDLFQETGLQPPHGIVHSENQWRHHGYHAFLGVDAQAPSAAAVPGGLLIALRADVFAAEEVRDVVDIVPGKARALDVVAAGGTLTLISVHPPGSGSDSWASKASFWADVAMYAAAKSAGGTKAVLLGGDFKVWLESPGHPTTKRFQALWEQCGFHRAAAAAEEDRRPTTAGHWLDSFLLSSPLVPWAVCDRPHLAPGRSLALVGLTMAPWSSTSR